MKISRIWIAVVLALFAVGCAPATAEEAAPPVKPAIEAPVGQSINYGQSLRESALIGGMAMDPYTGESVEGFFVWANGDYVPGIGVQMCQCEFVPTGFDTENYLPVSFRAEVEVRPIPLTVMEEPVCMRHIEYGEKVSRAFLSGGICTDPSGNEVAGSWAFADGNAEPAVGLMTARAVFVPEDSFHYDEAVCAVEVECVPCTPDVAVRCSAAWPGQPLSECVLEGWAAGMDGCVITGVFAFREGGIVPGGDGTCYDVTFSPDDSVSYLPVTVKVPVTFGVRNISVEAVLETEYGRPASEGILTVRAFDEDGLAVDGKLKYDDRFSGVLASDGRESIAALFIPSDPSFGGEIPVSVKVVYR